MSRLQEAEHRRLEVAALGFHWSEAEGRWESPHGVTLSDYEIDHLEPWPAYLRRWAQGGRMERWQRGAREILASPVRLQAGNVDLVSGTVAGIASVFGSVVVSMFGKTQIQPGAFRRTLAEHPDRAYFKFFREHQAAVGILTKAEEGINGLQIEGHLGNTALGRDTMTDIKLGVLGALSIGFTAVKERFEKDSSGDMVRLVDDLDLYEVSAVPWGADAQAHIQEAYSRRWRSSARLEHNRSAEASAELSRGAAAGLAHLREAQLRHAENLFALAQAEAQGARDAHYVAMRSKSTAQRLDDFATSALLAKSPYPDREQRPSPEREYWQYVAQVKAQGRQVFADGSFVPVSAAEAAYAGPLFAQIHKRRQDANNRREQALYEGGCQVFRVAAHQALDIKYAR